MVTDEELKMEIATARRRVITLEAASEPGQPCADANAQCLVTAREQLARLEARASVGAPVFDPAAVDPRLQAIIDDALATARAAPVPAAPAAPSLTPAQIAAEAAEQEAVARDQRVAEIVGDPSVVERGKEERRSARLSLSFGKPKAKAASDDEIEAAAACIISDAGIGASDCSDDDIDALAARIAAA